MKATHLLAAGLLTAAAVSSAYADVETNAMVTASWGYKITGLGESGRDVALVFTNSTDTSMTWIKPECLSKIEYLVVGGGGGGGGGMNNAPSGGGGAGGLARGALTNLQGTAVLNITVGKGGAGGIGAEAGGRQTSGNTGNLSKIAVGETDCVMVYGGGGGACYGQDGKAGACGGGAGGFYSSGACGAGGQTNGYAAVINTAFASGTAYGNVGGAGYAGKLFGAGGGGAGAAGESATSGAAGKGGKGLGDEITGEYLTYATGGNGIQGEYGSGVRNAAANTGNGGNGANGRNHNGGMGGSGVVILRYTLPEGVVEKPFIASKVYTGGPQIADVSESDAYSITANNGGTEAGDYSVNLRLNQGYSWLEGGSEDALLTFTITPAQNEWTVDPAISKERWSTSDSPGVLTRGETLFGTPVSMISKDDGDWGDFDGTVPTEAGVYEIRYDVPTSVSWNDPEETSKSVSFKIYVAGAIPAFTVDAYRLTSEVVEGKTDLDIVFTVTPEVASEQLVAVHALCRPAGTTEPAEDIVLAEDFSLTQTEGNGRIANLKPGETYEIALYGCGGAEGAMTFSPTSEVRAVTMSGPATGLEAEATFTNDPREFAINGSVTPGMGTTTVTVRWSLNSDALDQSQVFSFAADDEGMFSVSVPYAEASDALTWKVEVSNAVETATYGSLGWSTATPQKKKTRADVQAVTYTWTGNGGDNRWTNIDNWSTTVPSFGYPNSKTYATAKFTKSAVVDLDGGTFGLVKEGLKFNSNLGEVTLRNGTISVPKEDFGYGASGTTVIFDSVTIVGQKGLKFVTGSTVVFKGTTNQDWLYEPWNPGGKTVLKFCDGLVSSGFFQNWFKDTDDHQIYIENAVWTVAVNKDPGMWAKKCHFIDGADRQAQLVSTGAISLDGTWCITIPATGHEKASIVAVSAVNAGGTFELEVKDWKRNRRVPLVKYTGKVAQTSVIQGKLDAGSIRLRLMVDGQPESAGDAARRNGRLEWDAADNTLYYTQDSLMGMMIYVR